MGTGPRGGKRVREAAAAAAAAAAGCANATDEERIAAGTAAAAPSEWHARDPAERPSSKPKGNPTPPPKAAGAVDPEDVDRKSSLALTKKGFAAGAVARACASVRPTADDEKTSFNEQKRRRIAAVTSWLLEHAELWELPRETLAEAKRARGEADDENRHQEQETRGSDESLVESAPENVFGVDASERAQTLVKQGILPILETRVRLAKKASFETIKKDGDGTVAGVGAQDRERTGKSLRVVLLEKAAAR